MNRGQGAALQTGLDYSLRAGARYVVTFDADGQHSGADVPALLAPILAGRCDVVLGSRFLGDPGSIPFVRRQLLRAAVLFTRLTTGLAISDTHNGLRALSRRAASRIHLTLDRMAHASELLDQVRAAGLRYAEVPVHVCYTRYSRAKGQGHLGAVKILADYLLNRLLR